MVIREVEKREKSKSAIADEYGIPKSTLSSILKHKVQILSSEGTSTTKFRMRKSENPELEKTLVRWVMECRSKNVPITGPILRQKALEFAADLGQSDFRASGGWLANFKNRFGVIVKSICEESGNADEEAQNSN